MDATALISAWESTLTQPAALRTTAMLGADAESLDVGQREQSALQRCMELTGDAFEAECVCVHCAERMDIAMRASDLAIAPAMENEIECDGWQVVLRVPDTRDTCLALAEEDSEAALFARCVVRARKDDHLVQAGDLPAHVRERCEACLDRLAPLANLDLDLRCPACGTVAAVPLDIGAFAVERLGHWVEDQLDEVARLCRSYAWSEAHVLAMSPWRRRFYLDHAEAP